MIRSYKKMQGTHIRALDGNMGRLKDVYFDDTMWSVQYFVAEFITWFSGKDVLVPPSAVSPFDGASLKVELTKAELRACPNADSALPFALRRQYRERSLFNLGGGNQDLASGGPLAIQPVMESAETISGADPHLRSCMNVSHYKLIAADGDLGSIQDVLIDDSLWLIRFLVVRISGDDAGEEKLYEPQLIEDVEWPLAIVKIRITRNQALSRPRFDSSRHLDTSYETLLREMCDSENIKESPSLSNHKVGILKHS